MDLVVLKLLAHILMVRETGENIALLARFTEALLLLKIRFARLSTRKYIKY
jgi:hypothetical protein